VLVSSLPDSLSQVGQLLQQYGFLALLALMVSGGMARIMAPVHQLVGSWAGLLVRIVAT
jgi:hypothetical protein